MKQLFSIVLFICMFVGISAVTLAGDVIEKQSFETVDLEFEQSTFDFVVLEVVEKPQIIYMLATYSFYNDYINTETKVSRVIVDIGKIDYDKINTNKNYSTRSKYLDSYNLEIVNARSRLMCSYLKV